MISSFDAQFPYAPLAATLLFVVLVIWAVRARRSG
jgi:hypothetical protein